MLFPTLETERLHLVEIGQQYSQKYYEIMSLDEVTSGIMSRKWTR